MNRYLILFFLTLGSQFTIAQINSDLKFIEKELASFKPDTTTPPPDRKTLLASQLLSYSGILNVNEAVTFKTMEARTKKERSESDIAKAEQFFTSGNGHRWLNNAMINIYRSTFTEREMKKLDSFFRKKTGKKFVQAFPLVMIKGLITIEHLSTVGGVKL